MKTYSRSLLLAEKIQKNPVLIASHRGSYGGNIIENTVESFQVALLEGSDIIELDITSSTDGDFYLFHDDREQALFGETFTLSTRDSETINNLPLLNSIGNVSGKKMNTLEQALIALKGKCLINIDRAWDFGATLLPFLDQYAVEEQIILKAAPHRTAYLEQIQNHPTKYMFMAIAETKADIEKILAYSEINVIGFEVQANSENAELSAEAYINELKEAGYLVWRNALVLDDARAMLPFGDDIAILGNPDKGWGTLITDGADIIQTDWTGLLKKYLVEYSSKGDNKHAK